MGTDRVRNAEPWHLTRKRLPAVAASAVPVAGAGRAAEARQPGALLLFNVLADASIGLVMGLGSRAMFRRRPWPIKALVSAALSIVGLAFLGGITGSQSGIGPFRTGHGERGLACTIGDDAATANPAPARPKRT